MKKAKPLVVRYAGIGIEMIASMTGHARFNPCNGMLVHSSDQVALTRPLASRVQQRQWHTAVIKMKS